MRFENQIIHGDFEEVLKDFPDDSIDLIFTSPPYANQRKSTYGGVKPDRYVDWFLPKAEQFFRILKPKGTFVLNIKERLVNGERHTYVIELILEMKKQGWLWTEESFGTKKNPILVNGSIDSGIHGKGYFNSTKSENSICTKNLLWYR